MKNDSYLKNVRDQYEDYPYPARDPENEKGLIYSSPASSLDCLNFYCFSGKQDFTQNFRVLIPGGGTGDCTTYLAEQLKGTNAEIVYLDMTKASMDIAKERAKIRGLNNITWIHDSILNIPNLNLGKFDYISCTGVLHHLKDPQAGLNALKSVLKESGSMFIMLYGRYGRTGVYQMQDMLRRVNSGFDSIQDKIDNTKTILHGLPKSSWFTFNMASFANDLSTDIGIYDLLLHTQDQSYSVPELYDYIEASDLKVNKLYYTDHAIGDMVYQPETYIQDPKLLKKIKTYPFREQAAICEILIGQLAKQSCFISFHENKPLPDIDDVDLIPSHSVITSKGLNALSVSFSSNEPSIKLNEMIVIKRTPHIASIFKLIDGERTTKELINEVIKVTKTSASFDQVFAEFKELFNLMLKISAMYLRDKSVPKYASLPELESRMFELHGKEHCLSVREKLFK
tara:strand:- start:226 stop:1590 length:1365 start_codon:yes stop_codon:yes gene_type:complete